jgi:TPR repeat protein
MKCAMPAALSFLLAALGGCKGDHGNQGTTEGVPTSPPAASGITIANAMGSCDDVPRCDRDCQGGNAVSCRLLAVTFEFGRSDAGRDETLGTKYFDRACALGDPPGCVSSGQMHEYAHGVPKDVKEAAAAYARACTLGWQVGCANYAIMLENGRGVPKDAISAARLYREACRTGVGLACNRLRSLSSDGGAIAKP